MPNKRIWPTEFEDIKPKPEPKPKNRLWPTESTDITEKVLVGKRKEKEEIYKLGNVVENKESTIIIVEKTEQKEKVIKKSAPKTKATPKPKTSTKAKSPKK